MKNSKLADGTSLALSFVALLVALVAWRAAARASVSTAAEEGRNDSGTEWLRGTTGERFQEVERQLRGLDVAMMEIGYRFGELYFAGEDGNWDYAKYQTQKIETALQLALVRRPKRAESAAPFLSEDLRAVLEVVERQDASAFPGVMERLRTACMKCHLRENVPYFTVELPETRLSTIRRAASPER
jgi:hypothetical protein